MVTRWYRAPELICESEIYGSPVDVWGVGCVLAELLGRKIMFKGNSTREQLQIIIEKLGTPADDEMTGITTPHIIATIKRMGAGKTPPTLADQFPSASPLALDLLSRLLTFDQIKRCTVEEALAHPYLCAMHARADEPSCSTPFDWQFERSYPDEMPQELLQRIIAGEVIKLRAIKARERANEAEARWRAAVIEEEREVAAAIAVAAQSDTSGAAAEICSSSFVAEAMVDVPASAYSISHEPMPVTLPPTSYVLDAGQGRAGL